MEVKKFEAPTLQEALETIKRELGPEAIILQTKKHKRGFGLMSKASVEVTAAVSERAMVRKKVVESKLPTDMAVKMERLPAVEQARIHAKMMGDAKAADPLTQAALNTQDSVQISSVARPKTAIRYADIQDDVAEIARPAVRAQAQVAYGGPVVAAQPQQQRQNQNQNQSQNQSATQEIEALRKMIEELKTQQMSSALSAGGKASDVSAFSTAALQEAFDQLVVQGIERRFALDLIRKAGFEVGAERSESIDDVLDQVASEILGRIETADALEGVTPGSSSPTVMALVGPTGVGKTTTMAKIASQAMRRGLRVGLINLDYVKASAFEQLATFARVLNLPFRSAHSVDDLSFAIRDFATLDLILVDTTGRSQRDPESLKEIHSMLASVPEMKTVLVLSATTRDAEMYDMASRFSVFRPQGLIFSKLDETTLYGAIYNVPQKVRLPLLYFTTGQKVPDDIERATSERVVSLVMDL